MRLKESLAGRMKINEFELCVKNQFIWKNKQNNPLFTLKSSFFLMFAGRNGKIPGPTFTYSRK